MGRVRNARNPAKILNFRKLALHCVAILFFLCTAASARAATRDVILTTDCGTEIDDQWAIVYLFLNPQIHVKGIVTTHAPNIHGAEFSANCARDALRRLHVAAPPPVFAGSDVALGSRVPLRNPGADFIVSASRQYSETNRLVIITIGATTDVASAFLEDPALASRVEILTMGFNSWPQGTDPWNIKNDPLAYQVILASGAPVTIGAADVCRAHLKVDSRFVHETFAKRGEIGAWMSGLFDALIAKNPALVAQVVAPGEWVIWDLVTVAHLAGYARFATYPRPELNAGNLMFSHPRTNQTVRWITAIDEKPLWADFTKKLDEYNRQIAADPARNGGHAQPVSSLN